MLIFALFSLILSVRADVKYSISGMSSGGFMTSQMMVSHSASIYAAGIIAGGPYYCTHGLVERARYICSSNYSLVDVNVSIEYANEQSKKGNIDPVEGLKNNLIYIFSGTIDELVTQGIVEGTYNFYRAFMPSNKVIFEKSIPANHAWPTKYKGNPCWYFGRVYVNSCGYDGAGIILTTLLGPLYQKGDFIDANFFNFSQELYGDVLLAGLGKTAFIYIPNGCQTTPELCRLHLTFHGCGQNYERVGRDYLAQLDINRWAQSNNIIIIFPQTRDFGPDPGGCWDFVGVTGPDFALKTGKQIKIVHNMAQDYINIVKNVLR